MASTTDLVPVHPMETYRASKDYALFEAEKIRPFMRAAHDRASLFKESRLPLVVASGRPSIDNILNFLKETDYHNSLRSTNTPLPHSSSKVAPVDPHYFLEGYISSKRLDCFVWEGGFFEEGSSVILGSDARLAKVMGVVGVGRNYFMMGLKDSGRALEGELTLRRMVVSIEPSHFRLSLFQRFQLHFLKRFLGSMLNFLDEDRGVKDGEEFRAVSEEDASLEDDLGPLSRSAKSSGELLTDQVFELLAEVEAKGGI
jgi:hypothetical protein